MSATGHWNAAQPKTSRLAEIAQQWLRRGGQRTFCLRRAFSVMPMLSVEMRLNDNLLVDEWLWFSNVEAAQLEAGDVAAEITRRQTGRSNVRVAINDQHGRRTEFQSEDFG
jgi:hypothetical protein